MKNVLSWALGLSGLIPFYVALLAHWLSTGLVGFDPRQVFVAYSAVILAFLAGSLWGRAQTMALTKGALLLVGSNVLALVAFAALLIGHLSTVLIILLSGYVLVLLTEHYYRGGIAPVYMKMRALLTALVVLSHAGMLI